MRFKLQPKSVAKIRGVHCGFREILDSSWNPSYSWAKEPKRVPPSEMFRAGKQYICIGVCRTSRSTMKIGITQASEFLGFCLSRRLLRTGLETSGKPPAVED